MGDYKAAAKIFLEIEMTGKEALFYAALGQGKYWEARKRAEEMKRKGFYEAIGKDKGDSIRL